MSARAAGTLAGALLLCGAAFDTPSLYVPGVALALLALGAAGWSRLATRGATLLRLPGPTTVVEGEPYPLRIRVRRGLIPARGNFVDPLLDEPLAVGGSRDGGRESTLAGEARFERRGRRMLEAPRLVVQDPFGLTERTVVGETGDGVLVLPRVEPVSAGGPGGTDEDGTLAATGAGVGAGLTAVHDVEIDGLRPYRAGSPASRIHWPAVARHGELIERRLVSGAEGAAVVVLDARRPAGEDGLDRAVRAAASLCLHLARAGGCVLVVPGESRTVRIDAQLRRWPSAHARLALVEEVAALPAAARAVGGRSLFWVAGANLKRLPRGVVPGPGSYLVTPFAPPTAAFTVAGCGGVAITRPRAARAARSAA